MEWRSCSCSCSESCWQQHAQHPCDDNGKHHHRQEGKPLFLLYVGQQGAAGPLLQNLGSLWTAPLVQLSV
ncbi:hypothetical protein AL532_23930 [Pseudomonas monteilii]|nr:hypothetical protein AL532_23930 [Pseudomonas monteilii]